MRQGNLFVPLSNFNTRVKELEERGLKRQLAELLLQVELGFVLMEFLHLDDEPVTAVWAILSQMPLRYPRLQNLTEAHRRAIANARQIIPYSARFSWLSALRSYIRDIPLERRNYALKVEHLQDLDKQIIHAYKQVQHPIHQNLYEQCLSTQLDFDLRKYEQVEADASYQFEAKTEQETVTVPISFTQEQLDTRQPIALPWFAPAYDRAPFPLNIGDLL